MPSDVTDVRQTSSRRFSLMLHLWKITALCLFCSSFFLFFFYLSMEKTRGEAVWKKKQNGFINRNEYYLNMHGLKSCLKGTLMEAKQAIKPMLETRMLSCLLIQYFKCEWLPKLSKAQKSTRSKDVLLWNFTSLLIINLIKSEVFMMHARTLA